MRLVVDITTVVVCAVILVCSIVLTAKQAKVLDAESRVLSAENSFWILRQAKYRRGAR